MYDGLRKPLNGQRVYRVQKKLNTRDEIFTFLHSVLFMGKFRSSG